MPFRSRELEMLMNWVPGSDFNAATDRILLHTDWSDTVVLMNMPSEHGREQLVFDPDFLPENLTELPSQLKLFHDFHVQDDWWVCLYDGELTSSGPRIDIHAIGAGWSWDIHTSLGIRKIEPVSLDEIDHSEIATTLGGIYIQPQKATIHDRDYDRRHDRVKV